MVSCTSDGVSWANQLRLWQTVSHCQTIVYMDWFLYSTSLLYTTRCTFFVLKYFYLPFTLWWMHWRGTWGQYLAQGHKPPTFCLVDDLLSILNYSHPKLAAPDIHRRAPIQVPTRPNFPKLPRADEIGVQRQIWNLTSNQSIWPVLGNI